MIVTELFEINGVSHTRAYSDNNVMVASSDNVEYEVAEDLTALGKVYHETLTPIPPDSEPTDAEKAEAYDILVGVV